MGSTSPKSVLEALEQICNVDVDAVDPRIATSLPFKAHNQTSNQVIMSTTMCQPEFRHILEEKVKQHGDQGWEEVFNRVMVQFCANNIDNITNRALIQVSPERIYNKDLVLEQCYAYDRAFKEAGIERDRYAIKIAATGPGIAAAAILNKEGIRTLATSLFSLAQAVAANQANCVYISPYFNEVAAYEDDSLMCKSSDPAMDHPMAPRVVHILEAYSQLYKETGQDQPQIVIASNANIAEVLATAEIGCQHITILAHHLQELKDTPLDDTALSRFPFLKNPPPKQRYPFYDVLQTPKRLQGHSKIDYLAGPEWNGKLADIHLDYLANDGAALAAAIEADPAVVKKMKDARDAFNGGNAKAKAAIEEEITRQSGARAH